MTNAGQTTHPHPDPIAPSDAPQRARSRRGKPREAVHPGAEDGPARRENSARALVTRETYRRAESDSPSSRTDWQRHPLTRLDVAMAVVLFATALIVRWPFIERGETLLHSDEAIVGIMAQDIAEGRSLPIYFYGQRYMGALEAYVIAAVSPLFENPIHALRFGPACFFALMVAIQYLMLTRWFSRRGGVIGAICLLAASPMFMQWSISARGGYIEILLWGSALLWAYSEWFVPPVPKTHRTRHRFVLGAIIGSGLWINPSIVLFVLSILAHALLNSPLAGLRRMPRVGERLHRVGQWTGRATLPLVALVAVLTLNVTWAVWVGDDQVHSMMLMGLLPKPIATGVLMLLGGVGLFLIAKNTCWIQQARMLATDNAAIILGMFAGAAPAVLYVMQTMIGTREMDPSLPLGLRPLWLAGDNLLYLFYALPLLFGADARPFLQLVGVGYDDVTRPLGIAGTGLVAGANSVALGACLSALLVLLWTQRDGLSRLLRLRPMNHSPAMLLLLGTGLGMGLYVLSGCALDFTSIRYLVPLWVFLPGIMAAVLVNRRFRAVARIAPVALCAAWGAGQFVLYTQLGAPHPLRAVSDALIETRTDPAVAELFDAHLLSYLTRQRCRTLEFDPFWRRLGRYVPLFEQAGTTDYVVRPHEEDRSLNWVRAGWPSASPPETKRLLWPRLRRTLIDHPDWLVSREPLAGGYERFRLRRPLPEGIGQ